jgi:hypothetical protein
VALEPVAFPSPPAWVEPVVAALGAYGLLVCSYLAIRPSALPALQVVPEPKALAALESCPRGHEYQAGLASCPFCAAVLVPLSKPEPLPLPASDGLLSAWLVAVGGPCLGEDYPLYGEECEIGQGAGNGIPGAEGRASIGFDRMRNRFTVSAGTSGTVLLNLKALTGSSDLEAYDRLQLGQVTLLFIPFRGRYHDWRSGGAGQ